MQTPSNGTVLAFSVLLVACGGAPDATPEGAVESTSEAISNGFNDGGDPAVGLFTVPIPGQPGVYNWCTASLIAPHHVLTAAHCGEYGWGGATVQFGGTTANVVGAVQDPFYLGPNYNAFDLTAYADMAVLNLDRNIGAATLAVSAAVPTGGEPVKVVGFGASDGNKDGLGVKRETPQVIDTVGGTAVSLLYSAQNPGGTCPGDSGGPVLNNAGSIIAIVDQGNCGVNGNLVGSYTGAMRTDNVRNWILGQLPQGLIASEYNALGGTSSVLGLPTSDEQATACAGARYNPFLTGAIYWSPATGAHEVHGAIQAAWAALGYECGILGLPTSDETATTCGGGRYNNFQNGAITFSPAAGAHETHGLIRAKWASLNYECGSLGFPTTNETAGKAYGLRYNNFQGGAIVWTPAYGAFESQGYMRDIWQATNFESGPLGPPTSDPILAYGGSVWYQNFAYGQAQSVWQNNAWTCFWYLSKDGIHHNVPC